MKSEILLFTLMAVMVFSGCAEQELEEVKTPSATEKASTPSISKEEARREIVKITPTVIGREKIGENYNASILTVYREYGEINQTWKQIEYTKEGETVRAHFSEDLVDSLDGIKQNTPEDAVIVCWWDYGHIIRGYTGREVLIDAPSKEIADTTAKYAHLSEEEKKEYEEKECTTPHNKITDVAKILTAENSQEAIKIMKRYNANYLVVFSYDKEKSYCFFKATGEEQVDPSTEEFNKLIIGKAVKGEEIKGFELTYSDETVKVYNLT